MVQTKPMFFQVTIHRVHAQMIQYDCLQLGVTQCLLYQFFSQHIFRSHAMCTKQYHLTHLQHFSRASSNSIFSQQLNEIQFAQCSLTLQSESNATQKKNVEIVMLLFLSYSRQTSCLIFGKEEDKLQVQEIWRPTSAPVKPIE